ncbi:hypothetical protein NSQ77_09110 [Oceanobacillus sp. FSL K6-2867]|uniref:hypothetical protein n=1 Tax=Oceanobacillus sp. FSL K6-2867 TaxID=2954748 RepID=UPI0030D82D8D
MNSTIDTLITGNSGAQFPLEIRQFVYLAEEPTMTYGGYAIIEVYNADTGDYVRSERVDIAKNDI